MRSNEYLEKSLHQYNCIERTGEGWRGPKKKPQFSLSLSLHINKINDNKLSKKSMVTFTHLRKNPNPNCMHGPLNTTSSTSTTKRQLHNNSHPSTTFKLRNLVHYCVKICLLPKSQRKGLHFHKISNYEPIKPYHLLMKNKTNPISSTMACTVSYIINGKHPRD